MINLANLSENKIKALAIHDARGGKSEWYCPFDNLFGEWALDTYERAYAIERAAILGEHATQEEKAFLGAATAWDLIKYVFTKRWRVK